MATLFEIFFNFALSPRSIFRRSSQRSLGFTFPRSCPSMESMCFITYNLKSSWVKFKDLICFIYHSYFVGFKLLACFCSQNLFKLFQIHPVFACKALDVAYICYLSFTSKQYPHQMLSLRSPGSRLIFPFH